MSPAHRHSFAMTNLVTSRVVIPVLSSRAGRRLGGRLAVVEYVGRRTGRRHRLVAQYATDGRTVRFAVGMAERKTWWRNVLSPHPPHPVRLLLAGVDHDATAHVVRDADGVSVVAELEGPPID
ncbi:hypothetical protein [Cellulomonas sp. KRMCY2]|uniref:hypothetical protein n=1 Tax=Cellulomonas sp. KRMCY2 TaxID=1304865 RepID=UPI00045EB0B9|nr:hypothetical protein [Cellulomonas sp. KRMCY2]